MKSVSETDATTKDEEPVATTKQEINIQNEQATLTADEKHALRMQRIVEREKIISDWAKQPVNFVAIILLIIFMLMIIISYVLRPPSPMPTPAGGGVNKVQEQKK